MVTEYLKTKGVTYMGVLCHNGFKQRRDIHRGALQIRVLPVAHCLLQTLILARNGPKPPNGKRPAALDRLKSLDRMWGMSVC